jgi:hypothetical protein
VQKAKTHQWRKDTKAAAPLERPKRTMAAYTVRTHLFALLA